MSKSLAFTLIVYTTWGEGGVYSWMQSPTSSLAPVLTDGDNVAEFLKGDLRLRLKIKRSIAKYFCFIVYAIK